MSAAGVHDGTELLLSPAPQAVDPSTCAAPATIDGGDGTGEAAGEPAREPGVGASNKMALITSDCGTVFYPSIKWP